MASRLTGALEGAATGAGVGTSISPGVGTLVGAGVGALGGALTGGETEDERRRRERLEELQRRQELGTLGLTDEEMNVALGQAQGALTQQQQAQAAQQAGLLATQDLGAGAVMRQRQEEDSAKRKEMAEARKEVDLLDQKVKSQEEKLLIEEEAKAIKRREEDRSAMLEALGSVGAELAEAAGEQSMIEFGKAKIRARKESKAESREKAIKAAAGGASLSQAQQAEGVWGQGGLPKPATRALHKMAAVGGSATQSDSSLAPMLTASLKERAAASIITSGVPPEIAEQLIIRAGGDPEILKSYIEKYGGRL
jgi:hypothetical protein